MTAKINEIQNNTSKFEMQCVNESDRVGENNCERKFFNRV